MLWGTFTFYSTNVEVVDQHCCELGQVYLQGEVDTKFLVIPGFLCDKLLLLLVLLDISMLTFLELQTGFLLCDAT
jgi:hypothetical protein